MSEFKLDISKGKVKLINVNDGKSETIINFFGKNNLTGLSSDTIYKKFAEIINRFDKIKKYTYGKNTILDMTVLASLVFKKLMQGKYSKIRALEIGSWFGCSSYFLASSLKTFAKNNYLYCIDTWESDSNKDNHRLAEYENVFEHFRSVMKYAGVYEQIIPVVCDKKIGIRGLQNNSFDIIFINGDYGYDSAYYEIITAIKKIKPGGLIIGKKCKSYVDELQGDNVGYHYGVIKALNDIWGRDYENFNNTLLWSKNIKEGEKLRYQDIDSYQYKAKIETVKDIINDLNKKLGDIYSDINEEETGNFIKKIDETILKASRIENILLPIYSEVRDTEFKIMINQFKSMLIIIKIYFIDDRLQEALEIIKKLLNRFKELKDKVEEMSQRLLRSKLMKGEYFYNC